MMKFFDFFREAFALICPKHGGNVARYVWHLCKREKHITKGENDILTVSEIISGIYNPGLLSKYVVMRDHDLIEIYESVRNILSECCLTDRRQLKEIKEVRAICHADMKTRPLIHAIGLGIIAVLVSLFGDVNSFVSGFFEKICLADSTWRMIILISVWGIIAIPTAVSKQVRSSIIVSAIDDTLAEIASSAKSSTQLQ